MPLAPAFEQKLQAHMTMLKGRIEKKLVKYRKNGDTKKQAKYEREKWAIAGMLDENFEFSSVLEIYERYKKLDLPLTHYNFVEFY